MFILFGWRGFTRTVGSGEFFCPKCGKAFIEHKRMRRYFTLFFIPVIPLDVIQEYALCRTCGGTYQQAILNAAEQAQMEAHFRAEQQAQDEFRHATLLVAYLTAWADDEVDDREVEAICRTQQDLWRHVMSPEAVRADLERFKSQPPAVLDILRELSPKLSDRGKELVILAARAVADAKTAPVDCQMQVVQKVAEALARGQMDRLLQSASPPPLPRTAPPLPPPLPR